MKARKWRISQGDESCSCCDRELQPGEEVYGSICMSCADKEEDELTGRCLSDDPRENEGY